MNAFNGRMSMEDGILRYIACNTYHRHVPDDVELVERDGYIFFGHPTRRYDPITLALTATAIGTVASISGTLEEGEEVEKIAQQRAQVDLDNAEAVRRRSVEEATIKEERGRRLLATQKSRAAAGGVRINVGSPLVIATATRASIAKDIGFGLETGRAESDAFRSSAAIEIATGKALKKKSKFDALSKGLTGFGSIALGASGAGLFNKTPGVNTGATIFTGASAGFGKPTHSGGFLA